MHLSALYEKPFAGTGLPQPIKDLDYLGIFLILLIIAIACAAIVFLLDITNKKSLNEETSEAPPIPIKASSVRPAAVKTPPAATNTDTPIHIQVMLRNIKMADDNLFYIQIPGGSQEMTLRQLLSDRKWTRTLDLKDLSVRRQPKNGTLEIWLGKWREWTPLEDVRINTPEGGIIQFRYVR
ncbi:MAG: hypothetical protein LBQ68_02790 [Clostridiales bacterium]|jgi:hypothetical protein|nr:hypothetical protein [Clostridiales bacterium]